MSADVCGPFDESFRKYWYFVVFKDHYSKLRFICFIRNKSEVVKALREVLAKAGNTGHKIKEVLSDNGGEFDNEEVRMFFEPTLLHNDSQHHIHHSKMVLLKETIKL
jgi:hypothetical protein